MKPETFDSRAVLDERRKNLGLQIPRYIKPALIYLLLGVGTVIMIVPFLWMISTSLKTGPETLAFPPKWVPAKLEWSNYRQLFSLIPMGRFLWNSIFVAIVSTLGQVMLCSAGAYAFARMKFKGRDALFLVFLGTSMIPSQVTMIPQFVLMRYLGWIDSYQALIIPGLFNAFGIFLLRQFFLSFPKSLEEAAFMDGAGHFRIYWSIVLPSAKPVLATLTVMAFMQSWNNFLWPLIVISDPNKMTLPVGLSSLQGQYSTNWNLLMGGALISILPILVVYLFAQKQFVQGVTLSGIKD